MLQNEESVARLWVGYIEYRCYGLLQCSEQSQTVKKENSYLVVVSNYPAEYAAPARPLASTDYQVHHYVLVLYFLVSFLIPAETKITDSGFILPEISRLLGRGDFYLGN